MTTNLVATRRITPRKAVAPPTKAKAATAFTTRAESKAAKVKTVGLKMTFRWGVLEEKLGEIGFCVVLLEDLFCLRVSYRCFFVSRVSERGFSIPLAYFGLRKGFYFYKKTCVHLSI